MTFEFATATRIVFGEGTASRLADEARALGTRALVVTGASTARTDALVAALGAVRFPTPGEPTVEAAREGARIARESRCDVVIGFGGGSAIDLGKAIAALAPNSGEPLDYLEVVGRAQPLTAAPLPFIAVPTTAGTGSEVTRNAVLGSHEHGVKASLRSPLMLPRLALVDPELTYDLPRETTASTGLDALTQLIEPYVSARANPIADALCLEGMRSVARSLARVCAEPHDREARRDMALASLSGGLALANAGLGVVHGFAAPIGGMWTAPHGAVCAAVLPHGIRANLTALRARAPESPALSRYATVARLLTGRDDAVAEDGVEWIAKLCGTFEIPGLRAWGVTVDHLADIVEKAARSSSMKANPIVLTPAELMKAARAAL